MPRVLTLSGIGAAPAGCIPGLNIVGTGATIKHVWKNADCSGTISFTPSTGAYSGATGYYLDHPKTLCDHIKAYGAQVGKTVLCPGEKEVADGNGGSDVSKSFEWKPAYTYAAAGVGVLGVAAYFLLKDRF